VVVPVMARMVFRGGPPSRGGSASIQQPDRRLLTQQACCLRSLMRMLDTVIRNLVVKGAS
jgi:hypothetical protein